MKAIAILLVALMALLAVAPGAMAGSDQGGLAGAIIGCCFGVRSAAAYNEGKDLHWREWIRIIPYVNIVFAIFDGVDGMNGRTSADLATQYGSNYY